MLRRLGIRGKILAALSVPVLVLFVLAGLTSWQAIQDVRTTRATQQVLEALESSQRVVRAIQDEREGALPLFGPRPEVAGNVEELRDVTDRAYTRYLAAVSRIDLAALDPTAGQRFAAVEAGMGRLTSARTFVDGRQVPMLTIDRSYSVVLASLSALPQTIADTLDDRELASVMTTMSGVTQLIEAYEHEKALGRAILLAAQRGTVDSNAITEFGTLIANNDELRLAVSNEIYALGTPTGLAEVVVSSNLAPTSFPTWRRNLTNATEVWLQTIQPVEWATEAQREIDAVEGIEAEVFQRANERAAVVADTAIRETAITIGAIALAVFVAINFALVITRQITRPLRRLTEAAGMVRDELPHLVEQVAIPGQGPDLSLTRIPVTSKDEVGRLATAFNEVNETTIEVAKEQAALRASIAEMFVNVARRDQVLLNRQLSFIDALERSEEDPKTLADLFRLDHLATRMRRNAESLLVLAGIDTGRRLRGSLPTSDVIRTASSEIEHYERIQLDLPVDPLMLGHIALPAAHMLAELLENATVFSEPGTPVHVSTGIDETSVIIAIEDQGLGMSQEELDQANSRIRATSASDVLGSQRLGHYVVGRIAGRLGVSVEFSRPASGTGTRVVVRFPHVVFVDPQNIAITPPSAAPVVETFVRPEEAAVVAHDAEYVPSGSGAWDVPAGAIGSIENPAEEVDLVELTDGTTDLGLPRRRARTGADPGQNGAAEDQDAAAAQSIPLAPEADALAGAARARTDGWTPPLLPGSGLPNRSELSDGVPTPFGAGSGENGNGSLPTRRSAAPGAEGGAGLPTRQPVQPSDRASLDSASATGPANVEGRTAIFTGFRSRRAELAAAAIYDAGAVTVEDEGTVPSQGDGAERLAAAAAGTASFFGRHVARPSDDEVPAMDDRAAPRLEADEYVAATVEAPMVIPALVDDEPESGGSGSDFPAIPPLAEPDDAAGEGTESGVDRWDETAPSPVAESWAQSPSGWPAQDAPFVEAPGAPAPSGWAAQDAPFVEAPGAPAPSGWATQDAPFVEAPGAPAPSGWAAQDAPFVEAPGAPAPSGWAAQDAPFAQAGMSAPSAPEVDFLSLVDGPTRRDTRPQPKRRRLFGRGRKSASSDSDYESSPLAQLASGADADGSPLFAGGLGPVRQSAWNSSDSGAHAIAPPPVEPPPFEPPPFEPPPNAQQPWAPSPPVAPQAWGPGAQGEPPTPWEPRSEAPEQAPWQSQPAPHEAPSPTPAWGQPAQPAGPVVPPWANEASPQEAAPGAWGQAPVAPTPAPPATPQVDASNWSPATPNWSTQGATSAAPLPTAHEAPVLSVSGQVFAPQAPARTFDDEMTNMLAQRADIAQQALAELSQLSTYRPQAVSGGGSGALVRRTPASVPSAPEISTTAGQPQRPRDAAQVRSLLSSFQQGTTRGREMAEQDTAGAAPQTAGDNGLAGREAGPGVGRGHPVTTPDTDLDPRGTTW
jgi:signal transduction histidine kinase